MATVAAALFDPSLMGRASPTLLGDATILDETAIALVTLHQVPCVPRTV